MQQFNGSDALNRYLVANDSYSLFLVHHGIKGQRWGVRRWQYVDGSLTPAGYRHYGYGKHDGVRAKAVRAVLNVSDNLKAKVAEAKNEVGLENRDTYLKKNTGLYRIQNQKKFENFAFYATHKKHDVDEYAGLFGKNLKSRANAVARQAEKEGADNAQELRATADGMKIYQLKIANTERLKCPSEMNAGQLATNLLKDKSFNQDLTTSIQNAKLNMRRPQQQMLFSEAERLVRKDPSAFSERDKKVLYRALNLTLTFHNEADIRVQDKFYGALKKHGYSALLDLNDKEYSSYHAHNPVIVFDTSKVKLQAAMQMSPDKIEKLYKKYNAERVGKEAVEQTLGILKRIGQTKVSQIQDVSTKRMNEYLLSKNR